MASYVYPQNDKYYGYQGIPYDTPAFDHTIKPGAKRTTALVDISPYTESFEGGHPFNIVLPSLPFVAAPPRYQPPGQPSHVPSQSYQSNFNPDDLLGNTFAEFLVKLQGGHVHMGIPSPATSLPTSIFDGSGRSTIQPSSFKDKNSIAHGQQFLGHLSTDGGINPAAQVSNPSPFLPTTPSCRTPTLIPEALVLHDTDGTFSPYGVITPRRSTRPHSSEDTSDASNLTPRYSPYVAPVATTRVTRRKRTTPAPGPSYTSDDDSESAHGEPSSYGYSGFTTSTDGVQHCNFCKESFSVWQDVHWHCPLCPEAYTRDIDVLRHIDCAHKEIKFPCDRCGARMCRQDALNRHVRNTRRCPECQEDFCGKGRLDKHLTRCRYWVFTAGDEGQGKTRGRKAKKQAKRK